MDALERLKATVLTTIVRDVPKPFWEDARSRTRQTYADAFHQVAGDPNILKEHRLDQLYQYRHGRMEHLLLSIARNHSLEASPTVLVENGRTYVFVMAGAIGMTQSYVPVTGELPHAAKFRERNAAVNRLAEAPRLDLGDEPSEAFIPKEFYGLLIHSPIGKRFSQNDQKLGMLRFGVPNNDCSKWILQVPMEEILASYGIASPAKKPTRSLRWKQQRDGKRDSK